MELVRTFRAASRNRKRKESAPAPRFIIWEEPLFSGVHLSALRTFGAVLKKQRTRMETLAFTRSELICSSEHDRLAKRRILPAPT
jgi:hypothetical protein